MTIQEFMTTKIEYISADRSVYDAIERMVDLRIRSLVVRFDQGEDGYGVVTARDILFKVFAEKKNPRELKISEIASRPIFSVDSTTPFGEATRIMKAHNIARVFATHEGRIVGVVSVMDLMAGSLILRARGEHVSG